MAVVMANTDERDQGQNQARAVAAKSSSRAGTPVLDSFRPHLKVAADWAKVGRWNQVDVAEEIGQRENIKRYSDIDACLDTAAEDIRYRALPFATALAQCIDWARSEQ